MAYPDVNPPAYIPAAGENGDDDDGICALELTSISSFAMDATSATAEVHPHKPFTSDPLQFILTLPHEAVFRTSFLEAATQTDDKGIGPDDGDSSLADADAQPQRKYCRNIKSAFGILLGLFSGLTNSIIALLIKFVETKSIFEIAGYRYAVMIPLLGAYLLQQKANPFDWAMIKQFGWVLVLRAVVGAGATFTSYLALQKLPLADASVILFSSPVFVAIFGRIFLKEPLRWSHGFAIIVTLIGCILVARPPAIFGTPVADINPEFKLWGYISALAAAILTASVYVALRFMKELNSTIISFYTATIGAILSFIITGALHEFFVPTDPKVIGSIFGVGILSLVSNESMNRALRLESAGLIALLRTFDIVWSFIWQLTVFKLVPHYFSIIGAVLVIVCVALLSMKETVQKLPPSSRVVIFVGKMMDPVEATRTKVRRRAKKALGMAPSVVPAASNPV
ncbi:hypothetical protein RvY_13385 [Ramazzottius varieornatus]|uniref:EamA domain-containing protein n=1 Tax=Ramazzottius varieornatus TaxID=947166 RepID=A0A1D1VRQ4_RAMVA|nr:hypothetical protein RvY_13385 [Ramazzottius varieornatus]